MIPQIGVFCLALAILVTSSVSLGFVNNCGSGNLAIVKNCNYFLMIYSIMLLFLCGFLIYTEYKSKGAGGMGETFEKMLPNLILISGIIIFQTGFAQYAVMSNVDCGNDNMKNIKNCYTLFMVLGGLMLGLGVGMVYFTQDFTNFSNKLLSR